MLQFVKAELEPDERLLWASVSKPRDLSKQPKGIRPFVVAIGLLGSGFFLFYATLGPFRPWLLKQEEILTLGGVILVIAGIIALVVAFYAWMSDSVERDSVPKMTYALSDRRAMTWSRVKGSQAVEIFTFLAGSLRQVHRREYPDGSRDVYFDEGPIDFDKDLCDPGQSGFYGIDNVRRVEDLIRKTLVQPRLNRER